MLLLLSWGLRSRNSFVMIFGHTYLRIDLPEAKFEAEADFEKSLAVASEKTHQIDAKLIARSKSFAENKFGAKKWNVGNCLKHDNVSRLSKPCSRG